MAQFNATDFGKKLTRVPEGGNAWSETYRFVYTTAVVAGSTIGYGIIPAGIEVQRVREVHSANTATITMALGYTPVDSTNGPTANTTYWWAQTAAASAGAIESTSDPILFDFPVILLGTTAVVAGTNAATSAVVVQGKIVGLK